MNYKGVFSTSRTRGEYAKSYEYNKKQTKVLSTSMLTASLGFLAIFFIGFLSEYLIDQAINAGSVIDVSALYIVSTIGILVGVILSLVWSFRLYNASLLFGSIVITIYCLSYGIGFGFLFYALDLSEIMYAFATVAAIFLGTFLIAKVMSIKTALKLSKILFIATMVYLAAFFILLIVSFATTLIPGAYRTIILITTGISGFLSILYLTWSLWMAQNMDNFMNDEQLSRKMGLFIGFQILVNLIQLLILIIRLFLIFGRNN